MPKSSGLRQRGVLALLTAALLSCDIAGTPHDATTSGPTIRVVGNSIEAQGGVVAADGAIQLAFDRYLLPATITRQSFAIVDNRNKLLETLAIKTIYDPIARTVTIAGPEGPGRAWLVPDQSYKLVLLIPDDPTSDIGGFRAIDGAPLAANQKLQFVFRAGPPTNEIYEPTADFCADVLPIFVAKCASATCHGTTPAAGLRLDSGAAVRETALWRIAHASSADARSETAEPLPAQFGANMAIIAPGDPGSSYLVYKVELASPEAVDAGARSPVRCASAGPTADPLTLSTPASPTANDAERTRLGARIVGREMPYPRALTRSTYETTPLDFQERELVRRWIALGATTPDCGLCSAE